MIKMSKVKTSDFSEPDFSVFLESIEVAPRRRKFRKVTPLRRKAYLFNDGTESSIANSETSFSTMNDSVFKTTKDAHVYDNFGNLFNYFSEDVEVADSSDKEFDKRIAEITKKHNEEKNLLQKQPRNLIYPEKNIIKGVPQKPKRIFNSTMNSSFTPVPETDQSFTSVKEKISFFNSIQVPKQSLKCQCSCRRRNQTKESDQSFNSSVRDKIHYFNKIGYICKPVNGKIYKKIRPRPRSKNLEEIFTKQKNSPRPRSKNLEEIVGENLNMDNKEQKLQAVEVSLNLLEFCLNQWKSELKQEENEDNSEDILEGTTLPKDPSINNINEEQQRRHSTAEYSSQKILVHCQINSPPNEMKDEEVGEKKLQVTDLDEIESENRSQMNIYEKVHSTEGNSDSGNYSSCRNVSRALNFNRFSKRISVASYSSSGSSNKHPGNISNRRPLSQYRISRISTQTQTDASFSLIPSPIGSPKTPVTPKNNTKISAIEDTPMEFKTASDDFFEQYMPKYTTLDSSKKSKCNRSSFRASIRNLDEVKHLLESFKSKSDKEKSRSSKGPDGKRKKKSKITSSILRVVRFVFGRSKKN